MTKDELLDIPPRDPVTGAPLIVTELSTPDGRVQIRGRFRVPITAVLDKPHRDFLEVFLRSRGVISTVEKELGLSYPTVRARLDALLEAMDMKPLREASRKAKGFDEKRLILQELEEGKITAEEAKTKLRGTAL